LVFGATVSNALPPQASTEDVKSCKAISNDQQRLKCFDDLFADTPNQPYAADKPANEGYWKIEESKSPTDGSLQITAANLAGDTVLILRCKEQKPRLRFPPSTIGSAADPSMLRFALTTNWKASIDGRAAFVQNAVEFIRMLPDNAKLFIRTTPLRREDEGGDFQSWWSI
jgi:hypothetical protein